MSFPYLSGNFGSKSCVRKRRIVLKSKKRARSELLWFKSFLLFWHFSAFESLHAQVAVKSSFLLCFTFFFSCIFQFFTHIFEAFPKMDGFPPYTVQAWRHFFLESEHHNFQQKSRCLPWRTKTGSVPFESWASTSFGHFPTTRGFRSQMGWKLIRFDGKKVRGRIFGSQGRMYRKLMDIFKLMSPFFTESFRNDAIRSAPYSGNYSRSSMHLGYSCYWQWGMVESLMYNVWQEISNNHHSIYRWRMTCNHPLKWFCFMLMDGRFLALPSIMLLIRRSVSGSSLGEGSFESLIWGSVGFRNDQGHWVKSLSPPAVFW